jgi:agmatine deiminase
MLRWPAEWEPHDAVWTAWPYLAGEWADGLDAPRASLAQMIVAIGDGGRGERVELLVRNERHEAEARARIGAAAKHVRCHRADYGDVWLRDTAPIFLAGGRAARFRFDGWAGKYVMPGDTGVAAAVVAMAGARATAHDFVLEGGAIDGDGHGTIVTTRQCLLDGVRNPGLDEPAYEARLRDALGAERVVWLDRGLRNDHTDGHVDTLARFVAPGIVACMSAAPGDPNRDALDAIRAALAAARDAPGRRLEVVTVPSPGEVVDARGELLPASYMNFYIANTTVVVPTYDVPADDAAVAAITAMFPTRRVIGVPGRSVVVGGGAFHCCTQQQPRA